MESDNWISNKLNLKSSTLRYYDYYQRRSFATVVAVVSFPVSSSTPPRTTGIIQLPVDPALGKDLATNNTAVEGKLGKFFNKKRKRNEKEEKFL
ncbi:hypothetical protein RUM43_000459 [Polyplax serrata]|uniref:Uncharacterized protein n=1 Tax=Polyplax serrata TaxID=468196 RepID=A0AAN8SCU4_POLSC